MPKNPKSTNRVERMNSLIQQILGPSLQKYLENQPGLATISKVETSGDLKWAKVWVSIIGGNDDDILNALKKNIYDIQGELIQALEMKIIPRIQFFLDTSPRHAEHINQLIEQIHKEEGKG